MKIGFSLRASWLFFSFVLAGAAVRGGGFFDEGVNHLHWLTVVAFFLYIFVQFVPGRKVVGLSGMSFNEDQLSFGDRAIWLITWLAESMLVMLLIFLLGGGITGVELSSLVSAVFSPQWAIPYLVGVAILVIFCSIWPVRFAKHIGL
ncbi:hypothetical protein [Streptomyces sp. ST2-7A]|uniref:hypothetical protein n=1 Tax=Streptomyces sp. ST2-7A TaxID=2907214 RepID=UPI001F40B0CE|nr:hypothetical protein [Streptomyces sp. ST2-7A]MCE7080312.1 hypothetical protein [Streptomyces sp. ST2-7A]